MDPRLDEYLTSWVRRIDDKTRALSQGGLPDRGASELYFCFRAALDALRHTGSISDQDSAIWVGRARDARRVRETSMPNSPSSPRTRSEKLTSVFVPTAADEKSFEEHGFSLRALEVFSTHMLGLMRVTSEAGSQTARGRLEEAAAEFAVWGSSTELYDITTTHLLDLTEHVLAQLIINAIVPGAETELRGRFFGAEIRLIRQPAVTRSEVGPPPH